MTESISAPLVVVFPRGQLTSEDKAALSSSGVISIEADDPRAVDQLQLSSPLVCTSISGDTIVRAALTALASQAAETSSGSITAVGRASHEFVRQLALSMTTVVHISEAGG